MVEEAARAVEEADAELGTGGEVECCQSKEMSGGAGGGVEPGWDGTQMRLPPSIALGDVNDPSIRCTRPLDGLSNSLVRLVGRRGCMGKSKNRRRRGDVNSRIQPESSALMSSPPHFSCIRRHWQRARLHVVVVLGPVVGPVWSSGGGGGHGFFGLALCYRQTGCRPDPVYVYVEFGRA